MSKTFLVKYYSEEDVECSYDEVIEYASGSVKVASHPNRVSVDFFDYLDVNANIKFRCGYQFDEWSKVKIIMDCPILFGCIKSRLESSSIPKSLYGTYFMEGWDGRTVAYRIEIGLDSKEDKEDE